MSTSGSWTAMSMALPMLKDRARMLTWRLVMP
jgi:hypothetical protein